MIEVVLLQCNLVDNQHWQKSEVLDSFTRNKSYAYILNIKPSNLVFLKTFKTEFVDTKISYRVPWMSDSIIGF